MHFSVSTLPVGAKIDGEREEPWPSAIQPKRS